MPKSVKKTQKEDDQKVVLKLQKEPINNYNENFENTMNNIHAISLFAVKQYGRAGYQIKLLEQILEELKKLNKGK